MKKLALLAAAAAGVVAARSRRRRNSEADAALWREAVSTPPTD